VASGQKLTTDDCLLITGHGFNNFVSSVISCSKKGILQEYAEIAETGEGPVNGNQ
jgi:hypothetical protein